MVPPWIGATELAARGAVAGLIPAPFVQVNGPLDGPSAGPYNSWSADFAGPPPNAFAPAVTLFSVQRQGFDTSGAATVYPELMAVVQGVRQPQPNQALPSAHTAALNDNIYSTDIVTGAVNNSSFTSPKPVCNIATLTRDVVGNFIGGAVMPFEVEAYHRNARDGREVACVIFTISDGTTTITTAAVSTPTISTRSTDKQPVIVYAMPLTDITALTALTGGVILLTVNAKAYPWIGGAASVADSTTGTAGSGRDFGPRYFLKDVTLAATPPYVYIDTTGGGIPAGVVSTNPALAAATPFNNLANAWAAAFVALGKMDGLVIRVKGTVSDSPAFNAYVQRAGAVTFERDPAVARSGAVLSYGVTALRTWLTAGLAGAQTTSALRFRDITLNRSSGANMFLGELAENIDLLFDDIDFNDNSFTLSWNTNSNDYCNGVTFTNVAMAANNPLAAGANQHRLLRGISADLAFGNLDAYHVLGSVITRCGTALPTSFTGAIEAFNRFLQTNSGGATLAPGQATSFSNMALVQNVFEYNAAATQPTNLISGDGAAGSNTHVILHNNTFVGAFLNGRSNQFYDEGATPRNSILMSSVGNIYVQLNTKGDVFVGSGARIGNWAYLYGVGCKYDWSQYIDAASGGVGTSFAQAYPGIGSSLGTLSAAPQMATSNFVAYAGAQPGPIAGAGNGNYALNAGAPIKGFVANAVLPYDLAGTPRPVSGDTPGAYVAP